MQQERKNQSALQAASYYPQEAGRHLASWERWRRGGKQQSETEVLTKRSTFSMHQNEALREFMKEEGEE